MHNTDTRWCLDDRVADSHPGRCRSRVSSRVQQRCARCQLALLLSAAMQWLRQYVAARLRRWSARRIRGGLPTASAARGDFRLADWRRCRSETVWPRPATSQRPAPPARLRERDTPRSNCHTLKHRIETTVWELCPITRSDLCVYVFCWFPGVCFSRCRTWAWRPRADRTTR